MHLFSVSYDLLTPGKDYNTLYARLRALGAVRVLYSQWMLKRVATAVQLRDDLWQYVDANDRLLVIDATNGDMAWSVLETDVKAALGIA
jgi:hypothetical protein